ncbi:DNA mismatch repair protein, C-terminal domain-containing protein [Toxoplasma gondii MAS]|uniref:DNA mismatch repair protein, C-terminal domain-containing protein n=1 Tax=Toxoplasma gondii MAS TaxID=943118 RepID=A0A086QUF5_TOXGO|nr:DNA mismatch repair protein, C-terminal domain-containing protein [Toxoplasma gondii MAS]
MFLRVRGLRSFPARRVSLDRLFVRIRRLKSRKKAGNQQSDCPDTLVFSLVRREKTSLGESEEKSAAPGDDSPPVEKAPEIAAASSVSRLRNFRESGGARFLSLDRPSLQRLPRFDRQLCLLSLRTHGLRPPLPSAETERKRGRSTRQNEEELAGEKSARRDESEREGKRRTRRKRKQEGKGKQEGEGKQEERRHLEEAMEGEVASKVSSGDREGIQETDEKEEEGGRVKNRCQEAEANAGGLRPPVAVQDGRASTDSSCVKAAASSDAEQNSQSSHLSSEDILGSPSASSFSSLSFLAFAHAASSSTSLRPQSTSSDASSPLPSSSSTRSSAPSESSASSCSGSSSASSPSPLSTSSTSSSSSSSSASSSSSSASPSSFSSAASPASSSAVRSSSSGGAESERDTGRQAGRLHAMSSLVAEAVCSQQVVLGLKSICKELVENAIDAGATTVEVRFVDGGMASVEVRDNGSGIAPQDFPMLGRRHATSKINKFTDLYSALDTMGFRGEALASLCALSDVEILTRTASEPFATRLRFDHHGKIIHQEPAAREVGTSVTVSNLFASLPLRRRALRQQRQKHLQESLAFLQKFALLHADDCRILVTDFTPANSSRSAEASSGSQRRNGGSSVTLLNTRGTATRLLDAAVTVYGERQMQQCSQVSLAGAEPGREWSVEALLSRPPLGVRTSALQLFFVNKRVVEFPPLLQKLINKKYREVCSRHCFPIVIAFATVAPHLLEVNLRKDKQEVLLAVEKEITEALLCRGFIARFLLFLHPHSAFPSLRFLFTFAAPASSI